jgi:hypothetical protein
LTPVKRPKVSITPRSYSFSTFMLVKTITMAIMMIGVMLIPNIETSPVPRGISARDIKTVPLSKVYQKSGALTNARCGVPPPLQRVAGVKILYYIMIRKGSLKIKYEQKTTRPGELPASAVSERRL